MPKPRKRRGYNKDTTTDPVAIQHEQELKYKMGLRKKEPVSVVEAGEEWTEQPSKAAIKKAEKNDKPKERLR